MSAASNLSTRRRLTKNIHDLLFFQEFPKLKINAILKRFSNFNCINLFQGFSMSPCLAVQESEPIRKDPFWCREETGSPLVEKQSLNEFVFQTVLNAVWILYHLFSAAKFEFNFFV